MKQEDQGFSDEFIASNIDDIARLLSLETDPAALLVLKGHILIENLINRFLEFLRQHDPITPGSPALQSLAPPIKALLSEGQAARIPYRMSFMSKVGFLAEHNLIPGSNHRAIEQLAIVRNRFAHKFEKTISCDDVDSILKPLLEDPRLGGLLSNYRHVGERDVLHDLKSALVVVLGQLFSRLVFLSNTSDVLKSFQGDDDSEWLSALN